MEKNAFENTSVPLKKVGCFTHWESRFVPHLSAKTLDFFSSDTHSDLDFFKLLTGNLIH